MPTHLSYEELVRKNVVGEGKGAGGRGGSPQRLEPAVP